MEFVVETRIDVCLIAAQPTPGFSLCSEYFRCLSGEVICAQQRCDEKVDCEDMTDERSCHGMRPSNVLAFIHQVAPVTGALSSAVNYYPRESDGISFHRR